MSFMSAMFDAAIAGASGNFAPWEEPPKHQNAAERTHQVAQRQMPAVPVQRCEHNGKEGVSPGDLAGHAVNGEVNQGLNDIGIDVNGTVDAICEAVGNEVLRPDTTWGDP